LARVPPDELLPLRPGVAVGVGGGAVVEEAAVRGPRPRPLERGVALLPVRLLARRLVLVVAVDAAVDPAAARRGAVGAQELVARERLPLRVSPVDLGEHGL